MREPIQFSSKFLLSNLAFNWADLLWGSSHKLIGWNVPGDFARRIPDAKKRERECELAHVDKEHVWHVRDILEQLVATDGEDQETSKRKWLYATLLWLYENRNEFEDVLGKVEEVYADYEYPESIRHFVRFLPTTDGYNPGLHTRAENIERLMGNWLCYLEQEKAAFL